MIERRVAPISGSPHDWWIFNNRFTMSPNRKSVPNGIDPTGCVKIYVPIKVDMPPTKIGIRRMFVFANTFESKRAEKDIYGGPIMRGPQSFVVFQPDPKLPYFNLSDDNVIVAYNTISIPDGDVQAYTLAPWKVVL
jgi:hypothetical protein